VAAPVFSSVVEKTLSTMGVPPDLTVQPQIVAQQSEARTAATPEVN
jgi:cell division protein FtsI (penicillin-binding protein 3)